MMIQTIQEVVEREENDGVGVSFDEAMKRTSEC
jgi:hypothetical protein